MESYSKILSEVVSIFSMKFMIIIVIIGLILVIYDAPRLKKADKIRDYKIARAFGLIYIFSGPVLYIIGMIVSRK